MQDKQKFGSSTVCEFCHKLECKSDKARKDTCRDCDARLRQFDFGDSFAMQTVKGTGRVRILHTNEHDQEDSVMLCELDMKGLLYEMGCGI